MTTKVTYMAEPATKDIKYTRGDSAPMKFQLVDENDDAINIAGFTFLMTVDPDPDPVDAAANLFQLTGAITNAATGLFEFAPSVVESDQLPDLYFHDIQMVDGASALTTIARGEFDLLPDITKV